MLFELFMENLPAEVVGNILSHLGSAREAVIASITCCKWRESFRKHLHTLYFSYEDFGYIEPEIIITQTIFETVGLRCLSIHMDSPVELSVKFSAAPVIAWLMYTTRETLRSLSFSVLTVPNVNILEICGRQKLEMLELEHNHIFWVEPSYQRFDLLRSLSLTRVTVSTLDLSILLAACPKIETLTLVSLNIVISDSQSLMKLSSLTLSSPTLKSFYAKGLNVNKITLEADNLEILNFNGMYLHTFELIGKGALKNLKLDEVFILNLDIGESMNHLEVITVSLSTLPLTKFKQLLFRLRLKKLSLWQVHKVDEDVVILDPETIVICFSHLNHLCLSFDMKDYLFDSYNSLSLENVKTLELGCSGISKNFCKWVIGMVVRCPNLKNLVILSVLSKYKDPNKCQRITSLTSSIVSFMKRCMQHVDVRFEYK